MFDSEILWQAFTYTLISLLSALMIFVLFLLLYTNPIIILFFGIFLSAWAGFYYWMRK